MFTEALLKGETPPSNEVLYFTIEDKCIFDNYYFVNQELRKLFRNGRRSYLNQRLYMTPELLEQMGALFPQAKIQRSQVHDHFYYQFLPHLKALHDAGFAPYCICR